MTSIFILQDFLMTNGDGKDELYFQYSDRFWRRTKTAVFLRYCQQKIEIESVYR